MPARHGERRTAPVERDRSSVPWLPVLAVAGVATGLLVAALTLVPFDAAQQAAAPPGAEPTQVSGPGPGSPELSRVPGYGAPTPSGVGDRSLIAGAEAPGRQRSDASGTFRVLNSYGDSFIGEVLITNPTTGYDTGRCR